jgi:16S rRNA pseudouridine516 synthase
MPVLRLDKMLSDLGIASRREARAMIKAGRVIVNGKQTNACDMKLCTDQDEIILDGSRIFYEQFIYLMLNKPPGYLSAVTDSRSPTVFDLLDEKTKRLKLFPVGRLDKDTEGLLILTNDGEYSHRITAPRHGIIKHIM